MPVGVMEWFDAVTGAGAVVHAGRAYAAVTSDVECAARRAGAHVRFDIRGENGARRAVNVRLRPGGRGSRRHRRAGSLAGAYRPDTKGGAPFARPHPESRLSRSSHPLEVAGEWARRVGAGELDAALGLYVSDATVHADGAVLSGRPHLHGYLERSGLLGCAGDLEIRGDEGLAVVTWHRAGRPQTGIEVRCRVEHGCIAEQWLAPAATVERTIEPSEGYEPPRIVLTRGRVSDDDVDYARRRLGRVIDAIPEPVWLVRTRLSRAADPGRERPALAQVTVDVDGDLVRAHVAAREMREAVDLLQRRLRDQLQHRAQHRRSRHRSSGTSESGEWRHDSLPASRPAYFERPPEERQLVRHKSFAVDEMTRDEAAFDMELLEYGFYLFRDLASAQDAVLRREPDGSYHLSCLRPSETTLTPTAIAITVDARTPATMAVADAVESLDAGNQPFVFFVNATTGRGNVVYRRYDGHYGLITPE